MDNWPKITCWCNEDVPSYACLLGKYIINPIANQEPIMVVSWFGDSSEPPNDNGLFQRVYAPFIRIPYMEQFGDIGFAPALPFVLANGPAAVPKRTIFYAKQPMFQVCWMGYDEDEDSEGAALSDPYDLWFFARPEKWLLSSTLGLPLEFPGVPTNITTMGTGFQTGPIMFQRMGAPDTINKCVPVMHVTVPFGTWTNPEEDE